jgi:transposase-like protein
MCNEVCQQDVESLPLPKDWRSFVRNSVLNVIGIVRIAMLNGCEALINNRDVKEARIHRLESELAMTREELRINVARMKRIDPHRRPQYTTVERMAILELRAIRGWNKAETARRFFVSDDTIRAWLRRADDDSLVQTRTPVNRFPDFVRYAARADQAVLSDVGQSKDRRQVGQGRSPHRHDNRSTDPKGESDQDPGTGGWRHRQAVPYRVEVSLAHLARGSNCGADFRRLLDQLGSQRNLATVARLLVGLERGRSFFTALYGSRGFQVPTYV